VHFEVSEAGVASFLIDAPLEKIKGKATRYRGAVTVDLGALERTQGYVEVDLASLETHTFGDPGKDAKQTEHARDWLELGSEVSPEKKSAHQWVRFTIKSARVTPAAVSSASEVDGSRRVEVTAEGDVRLHGVTAPRTAKLAVTFRGPAHAPSEAAVVTVEPLRLSLKEHDVKPRDLAGKIMQGALERIGDKIVDEVQLSLEFTLRPASSHDRQ
jgi:polyisoprenoid-binding protein YceI